MARLQVDRDTLTVALSAVEKVFALRGDLTVPRSAVTEVAVVDDALRQVPGVRAPGLGLPGRAKIGVWRSRAGRTLALVGRRSPGVVVDLTGAGWRRVVVGCRDRAEAERLAGSLR